MILPSRSLPPKSDAVFCKPKSFKLEAWSGGGLELTDQ
jgi:hypothetical protein